uniref:Glutaredoxin domain-containing protein n=1 Tax=Chenopodium quinoa TaxID=63459 RepID=A0A803MJX3_CHEQI
MKSIIKSKFLKRFTSIPSIYTSKQNAVPVSVYRDHPERLSSSRNLQKPPNNLQQENITNNNLALGSKNNGHIISSGDDLLNSNKEVDVFEDCECGTNDQEDEEDVECTKNLNNFQEICPPEGSDKVVLYTTSLRGIRKTYEDCNAIKFLLDSFRVVYSERDVSMHLKFRDELWEVLEDRVLPPRLFIKGRYIGGADEVLMLHEAGMLKKMLQGIPVSDLSSDVKCCQCGGFRFLLCSDCNGSCKIYKGDQEDDKGSLFVRCTKCNENGLIKCPPCSY